MLLGQDGFPLYRCDSCNCWFERQIDGLIVPLKLDAFVRLTRSEVAEMQFEDKSTQCPNCQKPLTWISHIKRWEKPREIHEFNFNCGSCNRKFQFRDDQLVEKPPERDPAAEIAAVHSTQLKDAFNRRCLQCGGPITKGLGLSALNCDSWI